MLLLNALSDKSRWHPISVVLCADNIGEVYAAEFVFLAGAFGEGGNIFLILYYYRHSH
jgi:hypothetical protein